jgi:hypothetical protein
MFRFFFLLLGIGLVATESGYYGLCAGQGDKNSWAIGMNSSFTSEVGLTTACHPSSMTVTTKRAFRQLIDAVLDTGLSYAVRIEHPLAPT